MGSPSDSKVQNLLPVQAYFDVDGNFQTFIGQGKPFYATIYPYQSGLHITNSTIDSSPIGSITPSTGVFTDIVATTGTVFSTPTIDVNIANKAYVDSVAQGLSFKAPATAASTANIPSLSGLLTIDGVTLVAGNRVLVKNQTTQSENGIYVASASAWARSADANTWDEIVSAYLFVEDGDIWGGSSWVDTNQRGGTLGVTPIVFVQFSNNAVYTAGTGLTLTGFEFSITNIGTAGTYGSASAVPVLTTNAQGQVTSVTNTSISIAGTQITSGLISPTVGGTGVNNGSNTLTWNASYTLDQSVASGASPSFLGANFSSIPNGALTNSAVTFNGVTVSLGGSGTITAINPFALTLGTGLSGTSYDGSSAVTAAIANTGVTATSYTLANVTFNAQGQATSASSSATTGTGNVVLSNSPTISGAWASPDSISFDLTPVVPTTEGSLYWDSADSAKTLSLVMTGGNAIQQIGEETYIRIKASATITEGQVVMFTGTLGGSGVLLGAPATGLTASTAQYVMGVATEDIANNDFGYVTTFGLVRGINTSGGAESWVDGDLLYLNPAVAGGLTKTLPAAPNPKVQVCAVVNASPGASGSLFIRPSFGGILGQYEGDVGFTSTAANDFIQRNAGNTAWVNVAPSAISVGSATNLVGGAAGEVVYQVATNVTGFTAVGTTGQFLQSNGTGAPTWATPVSYATVTDDTTTAGTRYPLFANQTSGSISTEYTSSTKLQYNPSTGVFTSTSFSGAGTGLTGTASSLSIGGNAGSATNIAGGAASQLVYQTGSGATGFISNGTSGQVLQSNGASVPTWVDFSGGATIVDDTTTNSTRYPLFAAATTGTLSTAYTSSTELKYNPATGELTSSEIIASNGLVLNNNTVGETYSIPSGYSASSVGPVTIASGKTVTVPSGSRWVVL